MVALGQSVVDGPRRDVQQLEGDRLTNEAADDLSGIKTVGLYTHQIEEPYVRRVQRANDGQARQVIVEDVVVERFLEGERGPQRRRAKDAAEGLLVGQ